MFSTIVSMLGYLGMLLLAYGYYLISRGDLDAKKIPYQATQCIGCVLVGFNSFYNGAYPAMLLQIFCICVAYKAIKSEIDKKSEELESVTKNGS